MFLKVSDCLLQCLDVPHGPQPGVAVVAEQRANFSSFVVMVSWAMPNRSRKKQSEDENEIAARILGEATAEPGEPKTPDDEPEPAPKKNPHAVALGRMGGKKGGPARAKSLSARRRRQIA